MPVITRSVDRLDNGRYVATLVTNWPSDDPADSTRARFHRPQQAERSFATFGEAEEMAKQIESHLVLTLKGFLREIGYEQYQFVRGPAAKPQQAEQSEAGVASAEDLGL